MNFDRVCIFGFSFTNAAAVSEVAGDIVAGAARDFDGRIRFLITPNASTTVHYAEREHEPLKLRYAAADYVLADGMPIVWLSRLTGRKKLQARLTGSDLFPILWSQIRDKGFPATMVLSNEKLRDLYKNDYSRCDVLVPGFFRAGDQDYILQFAEQVADTIINRQSVFLFLGLNFPKQERLGIAVAEALQRKGYRKGVLVLLLGASFEFYFGLKKRAPVFFRKAGLEWLYRFASEPRRLWKRYTIDNVRFLSLVIKELFFKGK